MDKERITSMLAWAMHNRAEDILKFSAEAELYYWTPEAKRVLDKLLILRKLTPRNADWYGDSLLIGVIGKSGVGKSVLLKALEFKIKAFYMKISEGRYSENAYEWLVKTFEFKRGENIKEMTRGYRGGYVLVNTILLNMPDYGTSDVRKINGDLTELHALWSHFRTHQGDSNFIIFLQKELVEKTDHFFLRKMDIVELKPMTSKQLIEAFKMRFKTCDPFTEESLRRIVDLSRGVFRRLMRYIQLCLENMVAREREDVPLDDVKTVITGEVLIHDLDLELSDLLRNDRYKQYAIDVLTFLRDNQNVNQKMIAETLGIHATILGRVLTTLENNNYVKRVRGKEHGEWLVSLC
jgi:hypothetical protein